MTNSEMCAVVDMATREVARLQSELNWYQRREPLVRALAGATEDASVFSDAVPIAEWRALVDYEMNTPKVPA